MAARANGTLVPAGEGGLSRADARSAPVSTLLRSTVEADARSARAAGELQLAGEGPDAAELTLPRQAAKYRMARAEARAEQLAKR